MHEKYSKADLIISSYITELSLKKTATHFGYGEVEGEDEMKSSSEMVSEMVKLPKYEPIKSKIRNASGIVNFVTGNEYAPLVEFLLKAALPPNNNDIFNRGFSATLPSDYFIDAKYFMTNPQELENVIRGNQKKITKKWIKDQGWDIDDINDYFAANAIPPGEDGSPLDIKDIVSNYEAAMNLLKKDKVVAIINTLWTELQKDNDARYEINQLEGKTDGKSLDRIEALKKFVLSGEDRKSKTNRLIANRNVYRRKELAIRTDPAFQILNVTEDFGGGAPEYEDNGFMKWNPINKLSSAWNSVLVTEEEQPEDSDRQKIIRETTIRVANFINLLTEYRTSDRELMRYRNKILEILGNDETKYYNNYSNEYLKIISLMNSLVDKGKNHGKVLIFSNVENSGLVKKESDEGRTTLTLQDPSGIFSDFSDINDINEARDVQEKGSSRGKRTIVFISSHPISDLPKGSSIVKIDSSLVDEQEAKIIVKYLIEPYIKKASDAAGIKRYHDIEQKYRTKLDAQSQNQKERENAQVAIEIEKIKDSLAFISPEGRETLEQLIFGMGQKDAIMTIKGALIANAKMIKDEDGVLTNIQFNEEALVKEMIDDSNRRKTEGKLGLVCRKSKVKYDQYITKKSSEWGKVVGNLGITMRDADLKNQEISSIRKKIINIDIELMNPKLSSQTRVEKITLRNTLEAELDRLYTLRNGSLKDIPHFTVLWGKPGVGKCLGRGTPVIMFDGSIKNVEDIVKGDLLMGPDSKPRKVLTTIRGIGPLYKVSQKLGDDYVCNNAHILSLQSTDKPSDQEPIFISAEDFCKKNKTWQFRNKGWKVGIEFSKQELPLDPYWMGLWLGDGTSRVPAITIGNKDPEIFDWLQKWAEDNNLFIRKEKWKNKGCETWNFTSVQGKKHVPTDNPAKTALRNLNLLQNKHIPDIYMKNSSENRLALLAGLIDSDGYMDRNGSISFSNVNRKLAEDVLWLARSLGFRAFWGESIKTIKSIDYRVLAYTVTIGGTLSRIPTKLPRKQGHDNPQKKSLRYGINVNPIGEGEYFGFTIDGDQQFLLGDFTVTHNSVWADALADLGKFMIYNVEIGQVKSKWVGETSKFTRELLNTIFSSRNAVYLLDEIDRMMEMSEGSQGTGSDGGGGHETTKDIVSQFLSRFEDDKRELIDRNIFVIMTTNNLSRIDTALLDRTLGNVKQVEASDDPKDYLKYLQTFLETQKKDVPNDPWIKDVGRNEEEQWAYTFEFFRNKIDLQKVAESFSQRQLGFRYLSGMLKELCRNNNIWRVGKSAIERGETTEVHGIPLTTENILRASKLTTDTSGGNVNAQNGVDKIVLETSLKAEKLIREGKLVQTVDANGNKVYKLPAEITDVLEGKGEDEEIEQFIVEEDETTPYGKSKKLQRVPPKEAKPTIRDLDTSGFKDVSQTEEVPEGEVPQVTQDIPLKDQQKKKEKSKEGEKTNIQANTTDYLYEFLRKAQVITDKGKLKSDEDKIENERLEGERIRKEELEKSIKRIPAPPKVISYDNEMENKGVYFCNDNQVLIAPIDSQTPPQDVQRLNFGKK